MKFFKQVLAVIVGLFVTGFLFFLLFSAIIAGVVNSSSEKVVDVKDNSVLKLDFSYAIQEQNKMEDFNFNSGSLKLKENLGLQNIVNALKAAKTDDKIKGIYIEMSSMPNGIASLDVIRRAIKDFKTSDKFVIAYGEYVSQKAYYLSTVADKIYINPEGLVELRGLGTQLMFFKRMLDNLEAEVQVFKVGTFKSAIEPFIREDMSDANREQLEYLLGGVKEKFIDNISSERGISPEDLNTYIDALAINSADTAVKLGIIDGAFYYDQVEAELYEKLSLSEDDKINFIGLNSYSNSVTKESVVTKNKVAVIYAEGDIATSKGEGVLSSEEYAKIISNIRKDEDIKAIVLRINSPGGSALASDVIWRELELAKETKKVIVSMGNVAASGGYYIACNADYIFAEENTITGSIGVFGLVPNFEKFLNNKIGVTFDEVKMNEHATMNGVTNALDEYESAVIQKGVNKVYETFTTKVAEGRGMDIATVKQYAEGRVWTGQQAKERGLVDEIGDLDVAIEYAVTLVELDEYRLKEYPVKKEPIEEIMENLGMSTIKEKLIKNELGTMYPYYKQAKSLENNYNVIQAKMPFDLIIE